MRIAPELFAAYLKCPTKCWLKSVGERGAGNAYAEWVQAQDETYRAAGIERLRSSIAPGEYETSPPANTLKEAKWRLAFDVPAQTEKLESQIHAIERLPSEGRGKPAQFIPMRFISRNKLTKEDRLLVGFDALVLSETVGRVVEAGKIIHGDDNSTLKVKVPVLTGQVRKTNDQIATLLSANSPPDLILNRHCSECEFRDRCRQKAIEKDDLSLLAKMSIRERTVLNRKGIFTITQLSYSFRPRRRPKQRQAKPEKYHHSIKARAIREKKIHIVGTPELKVDGTPVYLDVEGLPDREFYYLIGVRIGVGESALQHSLWASGAQDEETLWRTFQGIIVGLRNPVIIHYGSYEGQFIKTMCTRYGEPSKESAVATALSARKNLLAHIYGQIYFPTFSNSLKEIASFLGFQWSDANASGVLPIMWRRNWEAAQNPEAKEKLLAYNAADCKALQMVAELVMRIGGQSSTELPPTVRVDSLKPLRRMKWGPLESNIPDFESITQAAHWDYQRDRVKLRLHNRRPSAKPKRASRPHRACPRISVVIEHSAIPACPRCGKPSSGPAKSTSRLFEDAVFGSFTIKRRLVTHQFWVSRCLQCRTHYGIPKQWALSRKYGWNLLSLVFQQSIELNISQRAVIHNLNHLFGFGLTPSTVATIKPLVADYYSATFQQILDRLRSADVLHVDETKANIRGRTAYVWVFCNSDYVAYLYAETREAELLHKHLKNFRGVLVSDFYSAYDGLECPQQKCLIHLIRDLNNDLMDNPYNDELKWIAQEFATLLRPMVSTVDRYGFKRYHLLKHKAFVERFFKALAKREFNTEIATKMKHRLESCRHKLFTFLEHDGVAWHNTNAEHAIKAFARLREVLEGSVTATGLTDYLVLLSICQTCKYQGLDFLDFLRSGEKDIEAFAEKQPGRRKRAKPDTDNQAVESKAIPDGHTVPVEQQD